MLGTFKALYVLLIKFPQVFPISPFYVKRNRNSERVNQMWNLCSLTIDVELNKGPEAVISTKCLGCDMGHGEAGTLTLMGGLRQQPNTGFLSFFFLLRGCKKPLKNLCADELWYTRKVNSASRCHVAILFCFYFSSC